MKLYSKNPKTQEALNLLDSGDIKKSLRRFKNYKMEFTKAQQSIITRAYEMFENEKFYSSLGFNKEDQINQAISIIEERYEENNM